MAAHPVYSGAILRGELKTAVAPFEFCLWDSAEKPQQKFLFGAWTLCQDKYFGSKKPVIVHPDWVKQE